MTGGIKQLKGSMQVKNIGCGSGQGPEGPLTPFAIFLYFDMNSKISGR
jgi:hypothetical protein